MWDTVKDMWASSENTAGKKEGETVNILHVCVCVSCVDG